MVSEVRHFLRVFRVEIDDIIEDLQLLIDQTDKRFEQGEITSYVRMANKALFQRLMESITKYAGIVDGIDASNYKGTSEIAASILDISRDYVSRLEDPEAVYVLLKRKLEKVKVFLSPDDSASAP